MPIIVFTYTEGSLSREKVAAVSSQIRESMIRHYAVKSIPVGLRAHTRMKLVEMPRGTFFVESHDDRPIYDVELLAPVDSVVGEDAEAFAREVTTAILTAEGAPIDDENAERIWCHFNEVPDRRNVLKHVLRYQMRHAKDSGRLAAE